MINELFKKKYKQTMEIHKTLESKVDLKKETSMGLMNILTFKPKNIPTYAQKKRTEVNQDTRQSEVNNL